MTPTSNIVHDIDQMKQSLQSDLAAVQGGRSIDISKLPDRLVLLHREAAKEDSGDRAELAQSLDELLGLLDQIAQEIHRRYEDVTQQLEILDPDRNSGE